MKNLSRTLLALILSIMVPATLFSCSAPSAANEARSLLESGNLIDAANKACEITDEAERADILEEIMLTAMDAENTISYILLGIEDLLNLAVSYSEECQDFLDRYNNSLHSKGKTIDFDPPQPNHSSAEYVASIDAGNLVRKALSNYSNVITNDNRRFLGDAAQDLDKRYRVICNESIDLLSSDGIDSYLATAHGGSTNYDPNAIMDSIELFEVAYYKAADKYEE